MRYVIISMLLLWPIGAQSQETNKGVPPVTNKTEWSDKSKNDPKNKQTVSIELPSAINVTVSGKLETKPDDAGTKEHDETIKWTDKLLAIFTGLLVVVTGGLIWIGWCQTRQLRNTVDAVRNEFISTNRPNIRVKHVWLTGDLWGEKEIAVNVAVVNVGITAARIREYGATINILRKGNDLPHIPHYEFNEIVNKEMLLESGITLVTTPITGLRMMLSHDDNSAIRNGEKLLYCYGYVEYEDMKRGIRKTAFIRFLKPPGGSGSFSKNGRFEKYPDPDYEYQD